MEDFATEIMFTLEGCENVDYGFTCWSIFNKSKFVIEIAFIPGVVCEKAPVQSTK